jgi:hypothetical protein
VTCYPGIYTPNVQLREFPTTYPLLTATFLHQISWKLTWILLKTFPRGTFSSFFNKLKSRFLKNHWNFEKCVKSVRHAQVTSLSIPFDFWSIILSIKIICNPPVTCYPGIYTPNVQLREFPTTYPLLTATFLHQISWKLTWILLKTFPRGTFSSFFKKLKSRFLKNHWNFEKCQVCPICPSDISIESHCLEGHSHAYRNNG